jgi:ferredoxin
MAYLDELEALGERVTVISQEERGLIDLGDALGEPQFGTAVYCCGPPPLLKAIERACRSWPPGALHVERFMPEDVDTTGDRPFEVVAERSGITATVYPGTSILDTLANQGVFIATSCGEGVCGTCETKVLDGEVDHRDALLTEDERAANTVMMVCCSRARGERLVLDV